MSNQMSVEHWGERIIIVEGRAFLHVTGHSLDKTFWPESDDLLHADIKDWGRRRDYWGGQCLPYEMSALTIDQVNRHFADAPALIRAAAD